MGISLPPNMKENVECLGTPVVSGGYQCAQRIFIRRVITLTGAELLVKSGEASIPRDFHECSRLRFCGNRGGNKRW